MYADELKGNLESGKPLIFLNLNWSNLHFYFYLSEVQNISEELLTKAMQEGCVECTSIILLLVGVAGAGKSSFGHILFDNEKGSLLTVRHSTPLAQAAIRAVTTTVASVDATNSESVSWKRISSDGLQRLLADFSHAKQLKDLPNQAPQTPDEVALPMSPPRLPEEQLSTNSYNQSINPEESSRPSPSTDQVTPMQLPVLEEATESPRPPLLNENLRTKETVMKICEYIAHSKFIGSLKSIPPQTWVYLIDSGGQPQFQELLPLFVKSASAVAFFVKLNERLDYHPLVEYYSEGKPHGEPYSSPLTHNEVLKNSLHTMQSRLDAGGKQKCPKLLFVGTFLDKVHDCDESVETKNAAINDMISCSECFRKSLISHYDYNPLFCVNAREPNEHDYEVANQFKQSVVKQFTTSEPFEIPIRWFVFEQILQELSSLNKSPVFSMKQCKEVASWLNMNPDTLHVPLRYLVRHNIVSWFENILPDVIFTSAQVILDKVTELVERSYILCNSSDPTNTASGRFLYSIEGIWRDFRHYGCITEEILSEFPKHYNNDFTPSKLLKLWLELFVVAEDSPGQYFMPCILRNLPNEDLHNYRISDTAESDASPVVIHYPKQFFPTGVFSCLISYLRNKSKWKILKERNQPKCFFKNCVQLSIRRIIITIIYSQQFIEVHPTWKIATSGDDCHKDVRWIRTTIEEGLNEVADLQSYEHLTPEFGIFCPNRHIESLHVACKDEDNYWECTLDGALGGKLTEKQLWWFQGL